MDIIAAGSRPSRRASADYFTGIVWQDEIAKAQEPSRVNALRVAFEPGARTAWHTHPFGQTLHVLSGCGLMGRRDAPPRVIRPGDTVWIEPGEEHWHGAGPQTGMVHLAIQESRDGAAANWLEQVTDGEYALAPD